MDAVADEDSADRFGRRRTAPQSPLWQAVRVDRQLLNDDVLARSAVVANCAMNRERQLVGPNSYTRELGFNPLDRLRARLTDGPPTVGCTVVGWLDLCYGAGRALLQAAHQLGREGLADRTTLVGVDLVDHFDPTAVERRPAPGRLHLRHPTAPHHLHRPTGGVAALHLPRRRRPGRR
jgi:hypothetical protein